MTATTSSRTYPWRWSKVQSLPSSGRTVPARARSSRSWPDYCPRAPAKFTSVRCRSRASPHRKRVAAGLAYVPQEFNVFANLTVGENLRVSTEFLERKRRASAEQRERVLAMFPEVAGRLGLRAGYLSGGQRQMLAFACAMMAAPTVLLLDEPSAGLSPKFVAEIFDKVKSVNALGVTVVMIEQNVKEEIG